MQPTPDAAPEKGLTRQDRLKELKALQRRYQRHAQRAMKEFFTATSEVPNYESRRQQKLDNVQSYRFAEREMMKPDGIRALRAREANEAREKEVQDMLHHNFTARPVPPTTFMNKYDLMVEEWRERKAAMQALAKARADVAKEEAAFVRVSAQALQHTRVELLGAHYDPDGTAVSRQELRRRATQERVVAPVEAVEVPLDVRMKLWPAIKEHEQIRKERIKQLAVERKQLSDDYAHRVMPLLSSPTPSRLPNYTHGESLGVGQPVAALAAGAPVPTVVPPPALPGQPAVPTCAVSGALTTTQPVGGGAAIPAPEIPALPTPAAVPAAVAPPAVSTAASIAAQHPGVSHVSPPVPPTTAATTLQKAVNPNCTFKPMVTPGVPDFQRLWAEDKVTLLERKKKRNPTVPQVFNLAPSPKDGIVRGKRPPRTVSRPPRQNSHSRSKAAREVQTASILTKGTRAHALRTEAVYCKYLKASNPEEQAEADDPVAQVDLAYWKEVAQRQKAIRKRLATYLTYRPGEYEATIRSKVRSLRASMKESEAQAQERLEEMKARVAQMPPVFAEPVHMGELTQARAEAERDILKMLQSSGLPRATIREILIKAPDASVAAAEAAASAVDAAAKKVEAPPVEVSPATPTGGEEMKAAIDTREKTVKPSSSRSGSSVSSSSFNSSSSSSDSSSSISFHAASKSNSKGLAYSEDSFESSDSD